MVAGRVVGAHGMAWQHGVGRHATALLRAALARCVHAHHSACNRSARSVRASARSPTSGTRTCSDGPAPRPRAALHPPIWPSDTTASCLDSTLATMRPCMRAGVRSGRAGVRASECRAPCHGARGLMQHPAPHQHQQQVQQAGAAAARVGKARASAAQGPAAAHPMASNAGSALAGPGREPATRHALMAGSRRSRRSPAPPLPTPRSPALAGAAAAAGAVPARRSTPGCRLQLHRTEARTTMPTSVSATCCCPDAAAPRCASKVVLVLRRACASASALVGSCVRSTRIAGHHQGHGCLLRRLLRDWLGGPLPSRCPRLPQPAA